MSSEGTLYNVADNSGVNSLLCLKNLSSKSSKISIGDVIVGVVKSLKCKKTLNISNIVYAVVIRIKGFTRDMTNNLIYFKDNSVVLVNNKYNMIGTRVLGEVPYIIKLKGFLKIAALSDLLV